MTRQEKEIKLFKRRCPEVYKFVISKIEDSETLDFYTEELLGRWVYPNEVCELFKLLGWSKTTYSETQFMGVYYFEVSN